MNKVLQQNFDHSGHVVVIRTSHCACWSFLVPWLRQDSMVVIALALSRRHENNTSSSSPCRKSCTPRSPKLEYTAVRWIQGMNVEPCYQVVIAETVNSSSSLIILVQSKRKTMERFSSLHALTWPRASKSSCEFIPLPDPSEVAPVDHRPRCSLEPCCFHASGSRTWF